MRGNAFAKSTVPIGTFGSLPPEPLSFFAPRWTETPLGNSATYQMISTTPPVPVRLNRTFVEDVMVPATVPLLGSLRLWRMLNTRNAFEGLTLVIATLTDEEPAARVATFFLTFGPLGGSGGVCSANLSWDAADQQPSEVFSSPGASPGTAPPRTSFPWW